MVSPKQTFNKSAYFDVYKEYVARRNQEENSPEYLALLEKLKTRVAGKSSLKDIAADVMFLTAGMRIESDERTWGQRDFWATPNEALKNPLSAERGGVKYGVGDCEDIALMQQALLLDVGFPPDKIFLSIGRSHELHAVLSIEDEHGDVYYLDTSAGPSMPPFTAQEQAVRYKEYLQIQTGDGRLKGAENVPASPRLLPPRNGM